jgi:integrase
LKDAVRHGLLQSNPADLADPPPSTAVQKAGLKVWTGAELAAFLQQSEAEGDRDHPLWRLIAATGMRRGEALGLRWADVDLGAGTVTVTRTLIIVDHVAQFGQPKTAAGARTIALDERTTAALRSHRARRAAERLSLGQGQASSDELAFADTSGDWLHPEAVSKRFDRRANRYGLPHIGVHGLRHTWATLALRAGVHPRIVQQRLGHSTIAVTLGVYSHVTDGMDLGAAQQVAALFEPTVTNL